MGSSSGFRENTLSRMKGSQPEMKFSRTQATLFEARFMIIEEKAIKLWTFESGEIKM